jgi:hypothetical protein
VVKARASFYDRYSPGRRDARVAEARAMLSMLTPEKLVQTEAQSLSALFNLKLSTAETILQYETMRRAGRG